MMGEKKWKLGMKRSIYAICRTLKYLNIEGQEKNLRFPVPVWSPKPLHWREGAIFWQQVRLSSSKKIKCQLLSELDALTFIFL